MTLHGDGLMRGMIEAGDQALQEVQREARWDPQSDELVSSEEVNTYIEQLEGKVRELAGAFHLAKLSQGKRIL